MPNIRGVAARPRAVIGLAVATAAALAAALLTVTPAVAATPAPHSSGCAHPGAAGVTTTTIDDAGTSRSYRLAVPPGAGPFGLVLNFHGLGSNDVEQAVYSQLEQAGPAAGYVVVTPQGTGADAFWNIVPNLATPDDVAYAGLLIDQTERTECVNPTRVYSTGISNGAGLSTLLGCRLANRLAAIAPVSGINLVAACTHGTPLSVLAFHGNADPVVPYTGGQLSPGLGGLMTTPVPTAVASWAVRDGCARTPRQVSVASTVTETVYRACRAGTQVQLYTLLGDGHTWPGTPFTVPTLGAVNHQVSATDLMLAFFGAHTRPGAPSQ
ncbi:MAG TPA: PHB depolymerase family esterase [Acidimicrobiia bacterium]|nr:PHB depolymerase family esterase [Acidimicrobiia bacterium]